MGFYNPVALLCMIECLHCAPSFFIFIILFASLFATSGSLSFCVCLSAQLLLVDYLTDYFDWYTLCSSNGHDSDSFRLVHFLIRNSYFLLYNPCYGAFILCFYYHFQSSLNDFSFIFHCLRWIQRERSYWPYPLGIDQKREYEQTTEWLNDIKTGCNNK